MRADGVHVERDATRAGGTVDIEKLRGPHALGWYGPVSVSQRREPHGEPRGTMGNRGNLPANRGTQAVVEGPVEAA